MFWIIFCIICGIIVFGSVLIPTKDKKMSRIAQFQIGNSNSQISIGNSNSCSTSNIDGHVKITGNIKSLTVNGKKIDL